MTYVPNTLITYVLTNLCKKLQVEKGTMIARIRSDQGTHQEFSSPKIPQHNGIVEQKNSVIQEMARVMLHNKKMPKSFWGEAINTACHILNRVYFKLDSKKTSYEL